MDILFEKKTNNKLVVDLEYWKEKVDDLIDIVMTLERVN